jgi:hypothetical protein
VVVASYRFASSSYNSYPRTDDLSLAVAHRPVTSVHRQLHRTRFAPPTSIDSTGPFQGPTISLLEYTLLCGILPTLVTST